MFLKWIKWPVAMASLLFFPALVYQSVNVLKLLYHRFPQNSWFVGGLLGYLLFWMAVLRKRAWGIWFSTFEHELTHILFALLTFHKIGDLRVTRNGGSVQIDGQNWLILMAPYFFPTLSVSLMGVFFWIRREYVPWLSAVFGVSLGYHILSNWREVHPGQSDLQKSGWLFAWLFLPSSWLFSYCALAVFAVGGPDLLLEYLRGVYGKTLSMLQTLNVSG
ncbi:MAG: M50 family metallopeptidase [SAR324 cluster bacterium]|nr:M50 family metallopeptidase [SAR324 cluster bacterium]